MKGLAQIPIIIGLLIMAVAIPLTIRLVQQQQDKRSSAFGTHGSGALGQTTFWENQWKCLPGLSTKWNDDNSIVGGMPSGWHGVCLEDSNKDCFYAGAGNNAVVKEGVYFCYDQTNWICRNGKFELDTLKCTYDNVCVLDTVNNPEARLEGRCIRPADKVGKCGLANNKTDLIVYPFGNAACTTGKVANLFLVGNRYDWICTGTVSNDTCKAYTTGGNTSTNTNTCTGDNTTCYNTSTSNNLVAGKQVTSCEGWNGTNENTYSTVTGTCPTISGAKNLCCKKVPTVKTGDSACKAKSGTCTESLNKNGNDACTVNGKSGHVETGLCTGDYNDKRCCVPGTATAVPTRIPTRVPTVVPTRIPTRVPTVIPTRVPTQVQSVDGKCNTATHDQCLAGTYDVLPTDDYGGKDNTDANRIAWKWTCKAIGNGKTDNCSLNVTATRPACEVCPSGTIKAGQTKIAGDANCDGKITLEDFAIWSDEFSKRSSVNKANFNCTADSLTDLTDFEIWRTNFKGDL